VRHGHEITGFCFSPQDGNALLNSVAATAWLLDPHTYDERLGSLRPYLCKEV
jgi:glyceraldehyde-3-phosphate dehydrogenase (NAD(P))